MIRRQFIVGLGGAAAAWPLTARAQQSSKVYRIAYLHALAENDPEAQARVAVLQQALTQLGWTERNVQIEHRFAAGDFAKIQAYAAELVGSTPDVMITNSTPALAALKQATSTIPIVFSVVNDPVGQGFVASLARPGGNITGFSYVDSPLLGKWLELLKEIAPSVKLITLMFNPQTAPNYPVFLRDFGPDAATLGAELRQRRCAMRRRSRLPCRRLRTQREERTKPVGATPPPSSPVGKPRRRGSWRPLEAIAA